jgi:hypothetical protein
MGARPWTTEQRAAQAAKIGHWKPWEQSTGARTPEGKRISSQNATIGKRNKQAAIEQAKQELYAAQAKLCKLTAKRGEWWNK